MSFPYTHPSMPGTPADFPVHVTATPKGPSPWHDICTADTAAASNADWRAELLAEATAYMALPLESPECSSSSASSSR